MLNSNYFFNTWHDLKFRFWMRRNNLSRCIVVHQMGKVGSSTIVKSLEDLQLKTLVFHTHTLSSQRLIQKITVKPGIFREEEIKWELLKRGHLRTSKYLIDFLEKNSQNCQWKIVTLVREPIGRNISAFFQNIDAYYDNFVEQFSRGVIDHESIKEKFLNDYPHNIPLEWLDLEIGDIFGIDVYKDPFPISNGYKIYSSNTGKFSLIVLRCEDLNNCYNNAFKEFLGIENFSLSHTNIASDKKYSSIYRSFIKAISLPDWYIEKMYSSQYAKHFYSNTELEEYTKKWRKI